MNEPVIVKNTFTVALVALLQAVAPSIVAVSVLYVVTFVIEGHVKDYFHYMAIIVALLMLLLPYPARNVTSQLFAGKLTFAASILMRWGILLAVLLAIAFISKFSEQYSRLVVLTWAIVTPAALIAVATILNEIMRRLVCTAANARITVFAGLNEVSEGLSKQLSRRSEYGMSVAGFFDDRSPDRLQAHSSAQLLGRLSDLAEYVKRNSVQVIFVALPVRHIQRVTDLLNELGDTTASVYYVPDIIGFDLIQSRTASIAGTAVVAMCETPFYGVRGMTKRVSDVIAASLILVTLMPLLAAIWLLVRLTSPGPAIFRQRRYGLNGEEITVYKFRTMRVQEDGAQVVQATKDDVRTTSLGRFLRRYSLDELPQLINVVQGRMSLVGPRPHAVAHNEMYRKMIKGYMIRHKVRPGITGLAQVNGYRGETRTVEQMEARVRYDLEYLRNWSVGLDLQILAKTAVRFLNDSNAF